MTDFTRLISALKGIATPKAEDVDWDESKHPRGNAANAGQFAPREGAAHAATSGASAKEKPGAGAGGAAKGAPGGSPANPKYCPPSVYTFRFRVGIGSSEDETIETSAPTFAKAVSNAMHRAANGNPRFIRQAWVQPVAVNGYAIRNYDILDADDPNRKEKTKDFQKKLVAFFCGHVPYYIPPQSQGKQHPARLPNDGSRPAAYQGVPGENHPGRGQPQGRVGHNAQGGHPHDPNGAKPVQSLFPFAQDSFPKKKSFYVSLVHALQKIGNAEQKPERKEEREERDGVKSGTTRDTQSRARETSPKQEVISARPRSVGAASARMTPQEVREMIKGNCSLIKTVKDAEQIAGIERRIKRLYEHGNTTPETLARYLEDVCGLEDWQAERIVKDQMTKYDAAANLERLKRKGVKKVMWCAGECEHHRPSHITKWPNGLNGVVFDIDHPPIDPATGEPTMPGQLINCHCYLKAVK